MRISEMVVELLKMQTQYDDIEVIGYPDSTVTKYMDAEITSVEYNDDTERGPVVILTLEKSE